MREFGRSAEGQASLPALVCFLSLCMLTASLTSSVSTRLCLTRAANTSAFDLAVLSQARGYVRELVTDRVCGSSLTESVRMLDLDGETVVFTDQDTFVLVQTPHDAYRLYYDNQLNVKQERLSD